MIRSHFLLAAVLAIVAGPCALAQEMVSVGSAQYPTQTEATIGEKKTKMKLTGAAMRKKAIFNVYTIGSYIQADFTGRSADDLAGADAVKQLHLVMQRDVSGKDMAGAFHDAIRANYPGNEFAQEMEKFVRLMSEQNADKGDQVWITHVPSYGLYVNLVGKKAEYIKGVKFAKAVWDIYLGPKNIGESVKKALVSRL